MNRKSSNLLFARAFLVEGGATVDRVLHDATSTGRKHEFSKRTHCKCYTSTCTFNFTRRIKGSVAFCFAGICRKSDEMATVATQEYAFPVWVNRKSSNLGFAQDFLVDGGAITCTALRKETAVCNCEHEVSIRRKRQSGNVFLCIEFFIDWATTRTFGTPSLQSQPYASARHNGVGATN